MPVMPAPEALLGQWRGNDARALRAAIDDDVVHTFFENTIAHALTKRLFTIRERRGYFGIVFRTEVFMQLTRDLVAR